MTITPGLPLSTAEAARTLRVPYHDLWNRIQRGEIAAPAKNGSGAYCWLPADVERARKALAGRKRKAVRHGR